MTEYTPSDLPVERPVAALAIDEAESAMRLWRSVGADNADPTALRQGADAVLSAWARLERFDTTAWEATESTDAGRPNDAAIVDHLAGCVSNDADRLVRASTSRGDRPETDANFETLLASLDVDAEPWQMHEQTMAVGQLISAIDDLDLLVWACRRLRRDGRTQVDPEAIRRLDEHAAACELMIEDEPSLFILGAEWARAQLSELDPRLSQRDPGLWDTAEKFQRVVEAAHAAEDESHTPVLPAGLLGAVAPDEAAPRGPLSIAALLGPPALRLAANTADREPRLLRAVRWRSPDGRFEAAVKVYAPHAGDDVTIGFYETGGEPTDALDGLKVRLGPVAGRIDGGRAALPVAALNEQADAAAALSVGDTLWSPVLS